MNDFELGEISEFIYFLADNAKYITMSGFKSSLTTKRKKDGSPVTKFDINAEKVIVDLISDKYPNHNIIAEEKGSINCEVIILGLLILLMELKVILLDDHYGAL